MCVSQLFELQERILINNRLLVVKLQGSQKLQCGFSTAQVVFPNLVFMIPPSGRFFHTFFPIISSPLIKY